MTVEKYNHIKLIHYITHYSYIMLSCSHHIVTLLAIWLTIKMFEVNPNLSILVTYYLMSCVVFIYNYILL